MAAPPILAEALAAIPCGSWDDDFEDGACHLLWKWRRTWEGGPLSFMLDDSWIADLMFFIFKDLAAS